MKPKMRINFVDVIVENSLKSIFINEKRAGYEFKIRLSDYRGLYLSCIELFELKVDGKKVDPKLVRFCLNGKQFIYSQLSSLISEFWHMLEPATIKVVDLQGLEEGEHDIELTLELRIPYLPLPGGNGQFMTLDSSGQKRLEIK